MIQPVTRDRNNEGEVIMMDMQNIQYIQTEDGAVVFYTDSGRFYPLIPSLSMYTRMMEGNHFLRLDRTNLVNLCKIKRFDEKQGKVYFDEDKNTYSQGATVALIHLSKLKGVIQSWIARNTSDGN